METKHTPGPWDLQELEIAKHGYKDWDTFCVRSKETNAHIATVGHIDRYYATQNKANAVLMTMAPELLDILLSIYSDDKEKGILKAQDRVNLKNVLNKII